jgi:parallel beta-helix repeat protein
MFQFPHLAIGRALGSLALLLSLLAPRLAAAAPAREAAAGGTFTVNWNAAGNSADNYLTLPEAILIANGGTSATGLNRALTLGEALQLSGCTLNAGGQITGGCGLGQPDTIVFTGLNPGGHIQLNSELPALSDGAATVIDGTVGNILPTVVRKPVFSFAYTGLTINSDNNVVQGIGFEGDSCGNACGMQQGLVVNGDFNQLSNVWVWKALVDGVQVTGNGNLLDGLKVGVGSASDTLCNWALPAYKGNASDGLEFASTANSNTVKNSWIGCNGDYGIEVKGDGNTIGTNNRIGTNTAGTGLLGNTMSGVLVYGDATTVVGNTVAYNSFTGLNVVGSNNTIDGNRIGGNADAGVALVTAGDTIAHGNTLTGNWIGTLDSVTETPNGLEGILIAGAHDNQIGHPAASPNVIGGNQGNGVRLTGSAYGNVFANNYIGVTTGFGAPLANGSNGMRLEDGAHDNQVGLAGSAGKNYINFNGLSGVEIAGAATTANTLVNNFIYQNDDFGVSLRDGAHHNQIGGASQFVTTPNTIQQNNFGIYVWLGAHHNVVSWNNIHTNNFAGVAFTGSGTAHNQVEHTHIHHNQNNGIQELSSASSNWWTQVSLHDNGFDGIHKQTAMLAPAIQSVGASNGQVTVQGTASPPPGLLASYLVEVYLASADGEGMTYMGSGYTDANGAWSATFSGGPGCYLAFQTFNSAITGARSSSKFGPTACTGPAQAANTLYVPLVVR